MDFICNPSYNIGSLDAIKFGSFLQLQMLMDLRSSGRSVVSVGSDLWRLCYLLLLCNDDIVYLFIKMMNLKLSRPWFKNFDLSCIQKEDFLHGVEGKFSHRHFNSFVPPNALHDFFNMINHSIR
ncbi:hypothetical protein SAY87_001652 [Trapa incisa]|uniref:Uncharacterized protein n=1 Tax=Trapa incisa TaxID=236973 RepID=A0AAN7JYE8_9MYRT|nr:hypothetical protein SAY87_001652 [Trapa incisa]